VLVSSVLWHCWLCIGESIQPVKIEWWGVNVIVCMKWGADCVWSSWCHSRTPSSLASFKPGLVIPFWYQLTQVVMEKRPLNRFSLVWLEYAYSLPNITVYHLNTRSSRLVCHLILMHRVESLQCNTVTITDKGIYEFLLLLELKLSQIHKHKAILPKHFFSGRECWFFCVYRYCEFSLVTASVFCSCAVVFLLQRNRHKCLWNYSCRCCVGYLVRFTLNFSGLSLAVFSWFPWLSFFHHAHSQSVFGHFSNEPVLASSSIDLVWCKTVSGCCSWCPGITHWTSFFVHTLKLFLPR